MNERKEKEKGKDLGGKAKNVFFRTSSRGCCRNRGKFKLANLSNGQVPSLLGLYLILFFFFSPSLSVCIADWMYMLEMAVCMHA